LKSKDKRYGRMPLLWAAYSGHEAVVELLLEKGAELESKDEPYGWTPLSWAAESGHEAVVKHCLRSGITTDRLGPEGDEYVARDFDEAGEPGDLDSPIQRLEGCREWEFAGRRSVVAAQGLGNSLH
jgi:hypothetical protein